jgi:hypothetical protein
VCPDGPLRMPAPRPAPREPRAQLRILGYRPLELALGLEPGYDVLYRRRGLYLPRSATQRPSPVRES